MDHHDDHRLTRDDFSDNESWLRYCHEGGIDLARDNENFAGVAGGGFYGSLLASIYGHTAREYGLTWAGWGRTNAIGYGQLCKAYRAVAFANCLGLVMDTSVDITWSLQGITSDKAVGECQQAFIDAVRRWLDRNDQWAAYLWVLERGKRLGLHTHMLMHLPERLSGPFHEYSTATLSRIVRGPLVRTKEMKTLLVQPRRGVDTTPQWIRFGYMMKGVDPRLSWPDDRAISGYLTLAERAGLGPRDEGEVSVQRLGVSRALNDSAFARWRALNDFPDMTISQDGPPLYDDRFQRWHRENAETLRQPLETRNGNALRPENGNEGRFS
jgi:hypothetical protein